MSKNTNDFGWGLQRLMLAIIILQSIGIRAIPFQGVIFSLAICMLLINKIRISVQQGFWFAVVIIIYALMSLRGMSTYSGFAYLILAPTSAFFCVKYINNRWPQAEFDILKITWLISLHGLISYFIYIIFPEVFWSLSVAGPPLKIFGIFIVSAEKYEQIRATGLCWEPGLLQLVANISLFLGVKNNWPKWKLVISFVTVLATFSTTGIFVLTLNVIYFILIRRKSLSQWIFAGGILFVFAISGVLLFQDNLIDKLGGVNTSGLVRLRDAQVGIELIRQNPVFGHGQFDEKYLLSNNEISKLAGDLFSDAFISVVGNYGGGYTNGFLGFIASYGVIIGTLSYYFLFRNRLIQGGFKERLFFFAIVVITLFSEPITNTSLFFFLLVSGIDYVALRKSRRKNSITLHKQSYERVKTETF